MTNRKIQINFRFRKVKFQTSGIEIGRFVFWNLYENSNWRINMSSEFASVVEEVKKMPYEEKEELKFLIEKYLIEEQREEIYQNYNESLKELRGRKIKFSSDINQLKELIEE
jgi:hypothetical protein